MTVKKREPINIPEHVQEKAVNMSVGENASEVDQTTNTKELGRLNFDPNANFVMIRHTVPFRPIVHAL